MDNAAARTGEDKYIVSACLAGFKTRYDGGDKLCKKVRALVATGRAVPFCPEQAGGLSTPRTPAEIQGGDGLDVLAGLARVVSAEGADVTRAFEHGARQMLELARLIGARSAILKAKSPSCGVGAIYDGTFTGTVVAGDGVAAAMLKEAGLTVASEEELDDD